MKRRLNVIAALGQLRRWTVSLGSSDGRVAGPRSSRGRGAVPGRPINGLPRLGILADGEAIFLDGFMPRMITADRGGGQDGGAKCFVTKATCVVLILCKRIPHSGEAN